jgi:ubiquinol-cytochrome c reductase cytochrome c subunit
MPYGNDTVSSVEAIVRNGTDEMDPLGDELTDEEITAVSAYVVSTFGAPGDVTLGGELFRLNCAGCHGAAGRGGALIYSETNAPSLTTGSNAITVGAIRGGPGTMPPFSDAALSDDSVASIATYVAVLRDPPHPGGLLVPPPGPVTEGFLAALLGLGGALLAAAWVTRGGRG